MPVKRKKERQSKKELKIREEERELENMTVEKRFSAKLIFCLVDLSLQKQLLVSRSFMNNLAPKKQILYE